MLSTIVYGINPKQSNPVEGFTSFSPTNERALERKTALEQDISSGAWADWKGERRRHFVKRCLDKNWTIKVKLIATVE